MESVTVKIKPGAIMADTRKIKIGVALVNSKHSYFTCPLTEWLTIKLRLQRMPMLALLLLLMLVSPTRKWLG